MRIGENWQVLASIGENEYCDECVKLYTDVMAVKVGKFSIGE